MSNETLYFTDNFFSAGRTDIFNEKKEKVGELDLKSAFSTKIDVLDAAGNVTIRGKFSFFGGKWIVQNEGDIDKGELKARFSLFSNKFQYNAYERGIYEITSEAFSKHYQIYDDELNLIANFEKVSGFFSSPAYQLTNHSEQLDSLELVAVVMGINAIHKRRNNNAATRNSGAH